MLFAGLEMILGEILQCSVLGFIVKVRVPQRRAILVIANLVLVQKVLSGPLEGTPSDDLDDGDQPLAVQPVHPFRGWGLALDHVDVGFFALPIETLCRVFEMTIGHSSGGMFAFCEIALGQRFFDVL